MRIDKMYFPLPEILERWNVTEPDLVYLAENDKLRLSLRVFDLTIEFGDFEKTGDGGRSRIPWERGSFSGLLDLRPQDVHQLFRCGELHLREFRTPRAAYAQLASESDPVFVLIGDLLIRREERDRFELDTGFRCEGNDEEAGMFLASQDYQDVRCNGVRFRLGPIQAEVVRALHEAALADAPWQNGKSILQAAGSRSLKMSDVFKSQKHWRDLIRSDRRGAYRLNVE